MESGKLARITEWWRPKAGTIFSLLLFYLAVWDVPFSDAWKLLLFSIVTLTGFGLTAYFLNDWADIPYDRKVGKANLVSSLSVVSRFTMLTLLVAITLVPWLVFFSVDAFSVILIVFQFLLMLAYPLPPVRLKNHPRMAMLADSLYAFAVPAVLAWHTFDLTAGYNADQEENLHFIFLAVWMLMVGLRQITSHHVFDLENDRRTGTPNLALSVQPLRLRLVIQQWLMPVEIGTALLFFLILLRSSGLLPLIPITIIVLRSASLLLGDRFGFLASFGGNALDRFNSFWLGVISGVVLITTDTDYILVLLIFLVLFSAFIQHPVLPIWIGKMVLRLKNYLLFPIQLASLIFNWSLYYFRKWVLRWSEERNWGEHYAKRISDLELQSRKERGTVAIFNQNKDKYTETFVRGHVGELPYYTIPFYGWPSMVHTGNMENLIADHEFLQKARYSWWQLTNQNPEDIENKLIAERLIKENVGLILAEFGMVGARLVEVSKLTGIPLVTVFYGYDAWNSVFLEENENAYQNLFLQASAVIGVSKDICSQLQKLGCNPEKISYLPCYVNLDLFQPVQRDFSKKVLLSVGRFCVTKAPHLTILAFNEVLKSHPDGELRMVGSDDGNGIMESCRSLVRSLGIEEKVKFLGSMTSECVADEMLNASVFVQHSVTAPETGDKEGTPVAIMEAMACGLPIVSTKHAGIQEVVEDGVSGILVNEFDYLRMAKEITDLLGNPIRLKEISTAASNEIRANRLVADHIQRLSEIIDIHKVKA